MSPFDLVITNWVIVSLHVFLLAPAPVAPLQTYMCSLPSRHKHIEYTVAVL